MSGLVEILIRKVDATEEEADRMKEFIDQVRARFPPGFSVLIRYIEVREVVK